MKKHVNIFKYQPSFTLISSSSSACSNGLAISCISSDGPIKLTCVPLATTKPNLRVFSVTLDGSSGSIILILNINNN